MQPCLLCQQQKTLSESHLIPKFVFKWLKETGSGYLRAGENLNIRIQDGPKHYLFCADCENQFSNYETYFAKNIFYPIVNDNASAFDYNEKLKDFVISVLWRLVKYDFLPDEKEPGYRTLLEAAEGKLRSHLLGDKTSSLFDRIYLICGVDTRHPDEIDQLEVPDRLFYYFARQVDAGVTGNKEHKFIYLKLPRMLFIFPIQGLPESSFKDSAIHEEGSYNLEGAQCLDPMVGGYFYSRVKELNVQHDKMSDRQKQKIADLTKAKWEEVKNKDLGIVLDYQRREAE